MQKRTTKRGISLLVTLVFVLSLIPMAAPAIAAEAWENPVTESMWNADADWTSNEKPMLTATWDATDDCAALCWGVWNSGNNFYDIYIGGSGTVTLTLAIDGAETTAIALNESPDAFITDISNDADIAKVTLDLNETTANDNAAQLTLTPDSGAPVNLRIQKTAATVVKVTGPAGSGSVGFKAYADTTAPETDNTHTYIRNVGDTKISVANMNTYNRVALLPNAGFAVKSVKINGEEKYGTDEIKTGTGSFDGTEYLLYGAAVPFTEYRYVEVEFAVAETFADNASLIAALTAATADSTQNYAFTVTGDIILDDLDGFTIPANVSLKIAEGGTLTIGGTNNTVLTVLGELAVDDGGTLTVEAGSTLDITAGSLKVGAPASPIQTMTLTLAPAAVTVTGTLTVGTNGALTIDSGMLTVTGGLSVTGTLTIADGGGLTIGGTLSVDGRIEVLSGGTLGISNGASLTLGSSGVLATEAGSTLTIDNDATLSGTIDTNGLWQDIIKGDDSDFNALVSNVTAQAGDSLVISIDVSGKIDTSKAFTMIDGIEALGDAHYWFENLYGEDNKPVYDQENYTLIGLDVKAIADYIKSLPGYTGQGFTWAIENSGIYQMEGEASSVKEENSAYTYAGFVDDAAIASWDTQRLIPVTNGTKLNFYLGNQISTDVHPNGLAQNPQDLSVSVVVDLSGVTFTHPEIIVPNPDPETFEISFDKGSGQGSWNTLEKLEGSTVTITKACVNSFGRKGYLFAYFQGSDSNKYYPGDKFTVNANLTLTAKYFKISVAQGNPVTLSNTNKGVIRVKYAKVDGASGYRVWVSASNTFASGFGGTKTYTGYTKNEITTCAGKKLKVGTTYYVKVRAYKLDSLGERVWGAYSDSVSIRLEK